MIPHNFADSLLLSSQNDYKKDTFAPLQHFNFNYKSIHKKSYLCPLKLRTKDTWD